MGLPTCQVDVLGMKWISHQDRAYFFRVFLHPMPTSSSSPNCSLRAVPTQSIGIKSFNPKFVTSPAIQNLVLKWKAISAQGLRPTRLCALAAIKAPLQIASGRSSARWLKLGGAESGDTSKAFRRALRALHGALQPSYAPRANRPTAYDY